MKTSIAISKPASVYHSGDSISGFVCLTAIPGSTIKKVSIDFCGTATTIAGGVSPYHERVTLISEREILYSGPDILSSGDHQWSFNFTVPECCEQHTSQSLLSKKDAFFNGSPRQSLPPTFEDAANLKLLSAVNRNGDEAASVTYCFKASFFDSLESDSKSVTITTPLNIQPRRNLKHPTWDTTTHACKFKIPLQNRRRASLTNIFTHRRGDSQEDAVGFSLRARMATTLMVGKPIPIFLLLEHDIIEDTTGPRSTFSVRSIAVTLIAETSIRGHSPIRVQHPTGESQSTWETSKQIGSKLTYSVAIQNNGILDIRSLIPDMIVPDSQTPSFATFNIVHIHSLKLKVELMYQDQSFTARYIIKRVIVLPATHKPIITTDPSQELQEPKAEDDQLTSPNPPTTMSTYRLRHSVDDELESIQTTQPIPDDPPSFEAAVSATIPTPTAGQTENPPPFEAAVSAPTGRRRSSLHPRLSLDDPPPFSSAIGEEELPSYSREETY